MESSAVIAIQKRTGSIHASITVATLDIRWKENIAAQNAMSATAVISIRKNWILNVSHVTAMMMNIVTATESNADPAIHPKTGEKQSLTTTEKLIFHCEASMMK